MQTEVRTGPPWSRAPGSKPFRPRQEIIEKEEGDNNTGRVREENQDVEITAVPT